MNGRIENSSGHDMWVLRLNDMRTSKVEIMTNVCRSSNPEDLVTYIENEKVPYYNEDGWGKNFRKGGPLEWYNPPLSCDHNIVRLGTEIEWVEEARERYNTLLNNIPNIETQCG